MKPVLTSAVASFDVFDTVLTRAVGSPASSFLLLGNKLKSLELIDCSAESFARARAEAERRAFINAGGIDSGVTIEQIYAELSTVLKISRLQTHELITEEMEIERLLLQPVPQARQLVESARANSKKVAFISDMYLDGEVIKQLLTEKGLSTSEDTCYVSSDYAKTKHSGRLYAEFLKQEGVNPIQVTHCGNHPDSDVKSAQLQGLQTRPFYEGNLNRYERVLEEESWASEGLSSVMAGAARLTRLTVHVASAKEKHLRNISASVAAPILIGFILWLLRRAQKLGLKRLYFVSRDGQILFEIASRLIKKLNYDCDLRYLYGSRQAWMLPSIINTDERHLRRACIFEAHNVSVNSALDRLNIQPGEIKDKLIAATDLGEAQWNDNLTVRQRDVLRKFILNDGFVQSLIVERAKEKRTVVVDYLRQEGLLEDVPYGMVDLGTAGTLHCALSTILKSVNARPLTSFYLGYRHNDLDTYYGSLEAYFFDYRQQVGFECRGLSDMLEIICSGDHGSVVGYKEENKQIQPVLTEQVNQKVMDWGYEKVRETIHFFAETIVLDATLVNPWTDVRNSVLRAFETFWKHPSLAEANAWGSFLMEDGWGNKAQWLQIAEPYQWKHLSRILKKKQFQLRKHWWVGGAISLTPPPLQSILKAMDAISKIMLKAKPGIKMKIKRRMADYLPAKYIRIILFF